MDQLPHGHTRLQAVRRMTILLMLAVVLGSLVAACGAGTDATATNTVAPTSTTSAAASTATSGPATEAPATQEPATEPPAEPTATSEQTGTTPIPGGPTATTSGNAETLTLAVYFIRDEKVALAHRTVPHTLQVAAAAMQGLLGGPTPDEQAAGMSSSIPAGTRFLGVTIDNKVATVDLSGEFESGGGSVSMAMRLAQVVYTLTQFPTIEKVTFSLDGKPVDVFGGEGIVIDHPTGRADFEQWTPAILVDNVAVGDRISSPVRLTGTANVFEATFQAEVRAADGAVAAHQTVTATSGTGTRGTFDVSLSFDLPPGPATVAVFALSAKDGSPIDVVEIPVTVGD